MPLFNNNTEIERKYRDLIRVINKVKMNRGDKAWLLTYVREIRDNERTNDFFDFDFLCEAVLKTIEVITDTCPPCGVNKFASEYICELRDAVRFLFPQGTKTENYEELKNEFLVNCCGRGGHIYNELFSKEFHGVFATRNDYLQVINIIASDDTLRNNFSDIVSFSVELAKEIEDLGLVKREIIAYITILESLSEEDRKTYKQARIDEARKRYGVYPGVDETSISKLSRKLDRGTALAKRFDTMEKKTTLFEDRINSKVSEGIRTIDETVVSCKKELEEFAGNAIIEMQNKLDASKKTLMEDLHKYLLSLEKTMRTNSDKVFNQLLLDAQEKTEHLTSLMESISVMSSEEVIKIQNATKASVERLKKFIDENPQAQNGKEVVIQGEEVIQALLDMGRLQQDLTTAKVVTESAKAEEASNEPAKKILVPDQKIVVPEKKIVVQDNPGKDFLVPSFTMTKGMLEAFDRSKKFSDRMKKIEEAIQRVESEGIIIPKALREALPWYIQGNKVIYLYGPTQSGKSTICRLLPQLVGSQLIDGGKITEDHSVTSYNDVNGNFDENALFYALYYGLTCGYDELDNSNADNIVVLGTYMSKLAEKIQHPERDVVVQFAKRRFVPVNANARIVAAGNTTGKGKNREYGARSKFDESSQERLVPIYTGYDDEVEGKIFGENKEWHKFFKFFRQECNAYAEDAKLDAAEGNVTTSDAKTIVDCITEDSMTISQLIRGIFVQTKEEDYLLALIDSMTSKFNTGSPSDTDIERLNKIPLKNLKVNQIASAFVYEANKYIENVRHLAKRR